MKNAVQTRLCILIAALLCSACAGFGKPSATVNHYALEYTPPVAAQPGEQFPFGIKVLRFKVSPLYNTDRIIYRESAFVRNEYHFHKWRANPGDMVAYYLKRDLQHASLFRAVFGSDDGVFCDYLLEGGVDEFLEQDHPEAWEAVLSVTVALLKGGEPDVAKSVLFQRTYHSRVPCRQKNPKSLAQAMSLAMAQVSEKVIRDLESAIADCQNIS